jgi:hypothetical protein
MTGLKKGLDNMNNKIKAIAIITILITTIITGCSKDKITPTNTDISIDSNTNEHTTDIDSKEDDNANAEKEETNEEDEKTPPTEPVEEEVVEEENHDNEAINTLTGLWISKEAAERRPVGVMINNLKKAMPQSGIVQADIIYETLVEGGITRLFAIFRDFDAEKIGPVRSARHYYLDFAFDHDSIYGHYGRSVYAKEKFRTWNSPNLEGLLTSYETIMTFQDSTRRRPHSTYTSFDKLIKAWKFVGYRETPKEGFESKLKFADEEVNLDTELEATLVKLPYSDAYKQLDAYFEFNDEDKQYYRFQYGNKHIDRETGEQLKFNNIIIQFTSIWNIKGDPNGCLDMSLVSSGSGYYITNGKAEKITWKKTSHYKPTLYYNENGEEIKLNKGKTFISVFPKYRKSKITFE